MTELRNRLQSALGNAYRIDRELGGGGMSRVFVATEQRLGRSVVIKVLPPEMAAGVSAERFEREIQLAASLQHPHIVPVLHAGRTGDLVWYTMPLIEGESLRARLAREGELPVGDAVRILRDVADALAYAHAHGVVHRDIKPDNVLLSARHAVVTDFGVAKAISDATGEVSITSIGVALGTPAYMAPEQAAAEQVDHRADVYSLGALAYEVLTGRPPFTGSTAQQVLAAHVTQAPDPLSKHRAAVPAGLAAVVMRCLQKKPADRWQQAADVHAQLESLATPSGGLAPTTSSAAVTRPRRRAAVAVAVGVVLVGALAMVLRGGTNVNPHLVAVLPFRVTGSDSSLRYLREGMVDLLAAKLTGEGGPRAADPQSVVSAWRRAVADPSDDLPRADALRLARRLGAGQIVTGGIVATGGRVVLNATTVAATSGRELAQVSVEGPADSITALVDRLAGNLMAAGAGEAQQSLAELTTASLPALRAYLDGKAAIRAGRFDDGSKFFVQALQLDSTFALAGLALSGPWVDGTDESARGLTLAWAARDRLSPRDRAVLDARAGPRFPEPVSYVELIAGLTEATQVAPDAAETWFELGDIMLHYGPALDIEDSAERAAASFRKAFELDSAMVGAAEHLLEAATQLGDTAGVRRAGAQYLALDSVGDLADFIRWRVALALGDTVSLTRLRARFDRMSIRSLDRIMGMAQVQGVGMDDAVRAARTLQARGDPDPWTAFVLEMNRGRPRAAFAILEAASAGRGAGRGFEMDRLAVWSALEWDGDTAAGRAAAARLARSVARPRPASRQEREGQYWDACALLSWRVAMREFSGLDQPFAVLRSAAVPADTAPLVADVRGCVIDHEASAAVARGSPDAGAAVARLDSLMRSGPLEAGGANLALSALYEARGDHAAALRASRRRYFHYFSGTVLLAPSLLAEGRLATLTGDRAAAIRAYEHYLALRSDPEPSVKPAVDAVRAELARLVGEP